MRESFRAKQKVSAGASKESAKRILRRISTPDGMPAVKEPTKK